MQREDGCGPGKELVEQEEGVMGLETSLTPMYSFLLNQGGHESLDESCYRGMVDMMNGNLKLRTASTS